MPSGAQLQGGDAGAGPSGTPHADSYLALELLPECSNRARAVVRAEVREEARSQVLYRRRQTGTGCLSSITQTDSSDDGWTVMTLHKVTTSE